MDTIISQLRMASDARLKAQRDLYQAVLQASRGGSDDVQAAHARVEDADRAWLQTLGQLEQRLAGTPCPKTHVPQTDAMSQGEKP